jgi:hypothetical protein
MADDVRRRPRPASRRSVRPHLPRRRARHSHNKPPGRRKPSRVQRQPQRCRDGGRLNRKLRRHLPLQLGMAPLRPETVTPDRRFRHPHKPSPQLRNRLARNGHRVWPSTARHRHHAQAPCARRHPPPRSSNNSRNGGRRRPNPGRRKAQRDRSRLRRKLGHNPRRNPQFSRRHLRFHRRKMAARQPARTTLILRW